MNKPLKKARRQLVAYTLLASLALAAVGTVQERLASPSFTTTNHK